MPDIPQLAGVILTHNEAHNIADCIDALRWADEVVVFDSFSTDDTVERARAAGARVIQHPFEDYGRQRQAALDAVEAEWIFFVDADERVTPELAEEVREKIGRPERGWWVPRYNYIFGRLTRGAGWYPDYQLRLLHRASARYDLSRPVHEIVILDGEAGYLDNHLVHFNYTRVEQFHEKQRRYIRLEAQRRVNEGMLPKVWTPFSGAVREFWRRFVTLGGYRDGLHGLRLSLFMAYYEYRTWRLAARMGAER
ncbi:MAG TPA: glycosyltransferase family 2 protein [Aggregatilineales bacterium]|nr:glycosyltransferase family 2 protein [Aggregatilineales bacterium]